MENPKKQGVGVQKGREDTEHVGRKGNPKNSKGQTGNTDGEAEARRDERA